MDRSTGWLRPTSSTYFQYAFVGASCHPVPLSHDPLTLQTDQCSRIVHMGTPRLSRKTERLLWLIPVSLVYSCYFPLSRYTATLPGHTLDTALDRAIPLVPGWMYVYALVFLAGFLPLFVVADRLLFRRVVAAFVAVEVTGFMLFVLYPVHMTGRDGELAVTSLATWGLRLTWYVDAPSNLFPSLHVALALLAALCCWKVDRLIGAGAGLVAAAISASTVLVEQHWVTDVVAGAVLATGAWWLFVARAPEPVDGPEGPARHPRWLSVIPAVIYGLTVLTLWLLYRGGWTPWETVR